MQSDPSNQRRYGARVDAPHYLRHIVRMPMAWRREQHDQFWRLETMWSR